MFILALDEDVEFKPEAVHRLIEVTQQDPSIGAACGRIHPVSQDKLILVMWYQKFEYAIEHWLQKSTEHIFGCVLCATGCFSLFRASALADKSGIIQTYAQKSDTPNK
ncbi:DgyrCDS8087 [Dimorphilus gyrociliatus]|uniref:chitin synthase n=1 Tax=Dimorphilus gyrociliatus TaxID=2664684 RepID=A0A7I8VU58_9ANNE|nr:DgyrCDS8087 [Dimorphilus gyrociliatus]